mmetsp:Transcript_16813/g.26175  ORF Transcript_16813/g.26175 Transcript_16813/m.26175 type:complete len:135 (-) Transcript_16813:74-478(-)
MSIQDRRVRVVGGVGLVALVFWLLGSGLVYDIIHRPPSVGQSLGKDGKYKPTAVLPYKINAQYLIEGLVGGGLFLFGGIFSLLLLLSLPDRLSGPNNEEGGGIQMWVGVAGVVVCSSLLVLFFQAKVGNYLSPF